MAESHTAKMGKRVSVFSLKQVSQPSTNPAFPQGDDLPPDITDKWIEREDAEEAAKAAAGEDSGGTP